jgi:DNA-binding HxlR family transcriptional regulator
VGDRRSYKQACGLAWALDAVGERWTLLIVRELLIQPRRFTELQSALLGIGATLLTERMHHLAQIGLVSQRVTDDDRRGRVYALTPLGEDLRPAVLALARWGMRSVGDVAASAVEPAWAFLALQSMVDLRQVGTTTATWVFHVDEETFSLAVASGRLQAERGEMDCADLHIYAEAATLLAIGSMQLSVDAALRAGQVRVVGDPHSLHLCMRVMGLSAAGAR